MKKRMISIIIAVVSLAFTSMGYAQDKATKEECISMCKKAAQLAADKGMDEAIKQVGDKNGPFVWKDSYIYIVNITTKMVASHPIKPGLVGKDLSGIKDINGKMFFVEITNIASEKGEGWVDYMWPKPGEKKPSPKTSFVYKVKGHPFAMVAGIYP